MPRRLLPAVLSALLVLTACGSGDADGATLDGITVSKDATPKVDVPKGTSADETTTKVIEEGSGDQVAEGDVVKLNYVAINGRTGKQFDSSYASGSAAMFTLDETSVLAGFIKSLDGQKVGSRVLAIIPPADGFGQAQESFDLRADDSMVFVFDIVAKVPTEATGDAQDLPDTLPQLDLDDDGHPSGFSTTDSTAKTQTRSSAHVVIEGDGEPIELDQTVTVQYVGQVYPDGSVFDSSWSRGTPATFQLSKGQLIECWTDQLVGQKVGSRVVLVCPSDTAYGDEGSGELIKGGDTLLFAIDLLDAS
ncbi:MAG TPA: FKBP-type peptidyl-prolyl cis-trans isomerase [Aeromicrobium sp.]|nr:FKBP-type peptidyl-prolyl cis-trans isomerase [Aeromicrobium sp.]